MTDSDRDRLRASQDRLIALAKDHGYGDDTHLDADPLSPTLADLRRFIYPDWEFTIRRIVEELEAAQ